MLNSKQQWFSWSKNGKINDFYEIQGKKVIGSGRYGQIIKVKEKGNYKLFRAIRIIPKSKVRNVDRFKYELNALRNIKHENVIKIYELYEDIRNLYIVIDLCEGGSLYDKILEKHVFTEEEARQVFLKMASAVNICHKFALCNKDLRPESFQYITRRADDIDLKTVDFAFQLLYVDDYIKKQKGIVTDSSRKGKLYYTAPEIFEGKLTEKADIWSIGVILHVLLTGELPFSGVEDTDIYLNIQNIEIVNKVEGGAKDLINKILTKTEQRISMFEILRNPWVTTIQGWSNQFLNLNYAQLKLLATQNQLQKIMMNFITESVDQGQMEDINELTKIFEDLDVNMNGLISIEELKKALSTNKKYFEIYQLLQYIQGEEGVINYLDFQNQIFEKQVFLKEERIYAAFKKFDLNNTGKISKDNLWIVLTTIEQFKHISKEFCASLISEVDKNKDGEIDYLEFIDMFFKKQ